MNTQEIKNIQLHKIQPNPNNPRKEFSEQSLAELAENIKAMGIIQPIIVRHLGNVADEENPCIYEIICGERRFRASQLAQLETIPAVVHFNVKESEVMEMALTENLLREDISPLEEMAMYNKLIEECDYTIELLMGRFGKSEGYIRNRIRLCNLIEEFHPLLHAEHISVGVALELCKYSKEIQADVFDSHFSEDVTYQSWRSISVKNFIEKMENNYATDLEDYFFDKEECYNCNFNTQVISLFTEDEVCGRCLNRQCLKAKNTAYIVQRAIDTHERNPELPLARNEYRFDEGAVEELTTKGYYIEVVNWCRECPTLPNENDFATSEEYQAELATYTEENQEIMEQYQKGEVTIFALINSRGVALAYKDVSAKSTSTSSDAVQTPLLKLQNQDVRNKQIAEEKTIADAKELVKGLDVTQGEFTLSEEKMVYFAMAKKLRTENYAKVGIETDRCYLTDEDRLQAVQNLTEEKKIIIQRDFIIDMLGCAYRGGCIASMLEEYATQHAPNEYEDIQMTHNDVYEKRHARIEEKISAIDDAE